MGSKVPLNMVEGERFYSRRGVLKVLGAATGGLAVAGPFTRVLASAASGSAPERSRPRSLPGVTEEDTSTPGAPASTLWNSDGPYITEPQKAPLILLTPPRTAGNSPPLFRHRLHAKRGLLRPLALGQYPQRGESRRMALARRRQCIEAANPEPSRPSGEVQTRFRRGRESVLRQ